MAGIDDALERLVTDPEFRTQMEQDPQAALAGYDLTDDERQLLTSQLSHEAGASGGVEQRTSKSGLAGALGMLDVGADTPQESHLEFVARLMEDETAVDTDPSVTTGVPTQAEGHDGEMDIESWSWGETQSGWVYDENSSCWIRVSDVDGSSASDIGDTDPVMTAPDSDMEVQDLSMTKLADKSSTHVRWIETDDALTAGEDAGDSPSGSPLPPADDLAVQDPSEEAVDHFLTLEDVPDESTGHNAHGRGSGAGKVDMQDIAFNTSTDPDGDPDNPVIVGSVYNAEEPEPSDGTNEIQDGLSNTVAVSEATDEPDSAASKKGNVEYEWKVEEGEKVDGGDPADLAGSEPPAEGNKLFVGGLSFGTDDAAPGGGQNEIRFEDAPGTEEADTYDMPSPTLKEAIARGKVFSSDDALAAGTSSTDTDTPPTLGDVVVVKEVD